jgi:P-type Ca2+ transporter type 2C
LIIDSPPSLALGVQPAAPNILTRLPRNPDQGIFTLKSGLLLLLQGISLAFWSVTLFVVEFVGYGYSVLDPASAAYQDGLLHAQGHCFITISVMQLSQGFSGRSLTQSVFRQNIASNKYMLLGIGISFSLLVACMYIPGWNTVFDQYPMNGYDWIVTFGFVVVHMSCVELLKFCLRKNLWMKAKPLAPTEKEWFMG